MPRISTISFGVEFEFDYVDRGNHIRVFRGSIPTYIHDFWDYQGDPTASSELRSPVFTSLDEYIRECNNQFRGMLEREEGLIPYMCNSQGRSLGQHMHIGTPNRVLRFEQKVRIARALIEFYPFMAGLQAQPIPSNRGLTSMYTRSMRYYRAVIAPDHYAEISDSHNGTVELRIFDSNIPQASLVNAWIAVSVAKKAVNRRVFERLEGIDFDSYHEKRSRALTYGLLGVNVTESLKRLKEMLGNVELPDIPCLKESLYLACRYRLNFWGVWRYTGVQKYEYMRACLTDVSKYLENLLEVSRVRHREKLERWIEESHEVETIDQLIGVSIAVDRSLAEAITQAIEERADMERVERVVSRGRLSRRFVRRVIEAGEYSICRISQVYLIDRSTYTLDVAERISELLRDHGDSMVNVLEPNEVIEDPRRFYVFVARDSMRNITEICGCIAVRVRTGEISSLVVDRRFRRLGIARRLLREALGVLRNEGANEAYAWVRRNNVASMNLFLSEGFRVVDENENAVRVARSL